MKAIKHIFISVTSILIIGCIHSSEQKTDEVFVFCAAGLTELIDELNDSIANYTDASIRLNLASSGNLARQLSHGNGAHIYISASKLWADYADSLGLFISRKKLCQNKLVFISPIEAEAQCINFQSDQYPEFSGYLSMGDPDYVPAGTYAREALIRLEWWEVLSKRILPAKDVRSALLPVELGECQLGITYQSNAINSEKVEIISELPDSLHTPIIFHALLAADAPIQAQKYFNMLSDTSFHEVWIRHGLIPVN